MLENTLRNELKNSLDSKKNLSRVKICREKIGNRCFPKDLVTRRGQRFVPYPRDYQIIGKSWHKKGKYFFRAF